MKEAPWTRKYVLQLHKSQYWNNNVINNHSPTSYVINVKTAQELGFFPDELGRRMCQWQNTPQNVVELGLVSWEEWGNIQGAKVWHLIGSTRHLQNVIEKNAEEYNRYCKVFRINGPLPTLIGVNLLNYRSLKIKFCWKPYLISYANLDEM